LPWGLIGPGRVANRFAKAVHRLPAARLHAVLGRDAARAAALAETWSGDGVLPAPAPSP
jgi:predicted dehydrogenase